MEDGIPDGRLVGIPVGTPDGNEVGWELGRVLGRELVGALDGMSVCTKVIFPQIMRSPATHTCCRSSDIVTDCAFGPSNHPLSINQSSESEKFIFIIKATGETIAVVSPELVVANPEIFHSIKFNCWI